jgi:hypothetical protein
MHLQGSQFVCFVVRKKATQKESFTIQSTSKRACFVSQSNFPVEEGVQYIFVLFTLCSTICQSQSQEPRMHLTLASNASSNPVISAWSSSASFILGLPPYDQVLAGHPSSWCKICNKGIEGRVQKPALLTVWF